jgi:DNA-binding NarL/FixJ family response regulator
VVSTSQTSALAGTSAGAYDPSVDEALRALVALVVSTTEDRSAEEGRLSAEDVLIDTVVAGFRYLLVRMPQPAVRRPHLSPREQEIVRMVAEGHPNKVIADVLAISSWTVCTHLRRIFAKLGVCSRAAMVAQLLQMGIIHSRNYNNLADRPRMIDNRAWSHKSHVSG